MHCHLCGGEMVAGAAFCQHCGAQRAHEAGTDRQPLRRSQVDRQIAGLCGGIARYLDVDPVFVRVLWVVLSIVPGTILLGVLAYAVGWLIVPEAVHGTEPIVTGGRKRLQRSTTDVTIGGVCGGIAEYFQVDATAVRLLWVVLSVFPGLIVGGVLVYVLVWLIMPAPPQVAAPAQAHAQPQTPPPPPPSDTAGAAAPE